MKKSLDPKASQGAQKLQLHLLPPAGNEAMARALEHGAKRYGERNWVQTQVCLTTYISAMRRHIDCLLDGENLDLDSGVHHLGHVMAGCGIVLDAMRHGTLVDDRVLPKR